MAAARWGLKRGRRNEAPRDQRGQAVHAAQRNQDEACLRAGVRVLFRAAPYRVYLLLRFVRCRGPTAAPARAHF